MVQRKRWSNLDERKGTTAQGGFVSGIKTLAQARRLAGPNGDIWHDLGSGTYRVRDRRQNSGGSRTDRKPELRDPGVSRGKQINAGEKTFSFIEKPGRKGIEVWERIGTGRWRLVNNGNLPAELQKAVDAEAKKAARKKKA